jgi:nucleotide-binding universal stress UspA family protein
MYKRILAPIDGSATSKRGLDEAIRLAKDQQAQLHIVHVLSDAYVNVALLSGAYAGDLLPRLRAEADSVLASAGAAARAAVPETQISLLEYHGSQIAEAIIAEATKWQADLIVMGTHGRRGIARAVMGSDAEYVVRHAPVPLLLVRSA